VKTGTVVRRSAGLVLAVAAATGAFISNTTQHFQSCHDDLATVGDVPVVHVCGPIQPTDSASIAVVLLELLLWAPDLSEAEFLGVKWKRRLEQAVEAQEALERKVNDLTLTVRSVQALQVNVGTGQWDQGALKAALADALDDLDLKKGLIRDE
jgi:hypothetical protein